MGIDSTQAARLWMSQNDSINTLALEWMLCRKKQQEWRYLQLNELSVCNAYVYQMYFGVIDSSHCVWRRSHQMVESNMTNWLIDGCVSIVDHNLWYYSSISARKWFGFCIIFVNIVHKCHFKLFHHWIQMSIFHCALFTTKSSSKQTWEKKFIYYTYIFASHYMATKPREPTIPTELKIQKQKRKFIRKKKKCKYLD